MSVSPTNETTRRGNRVLHSRLPVSLRHCPSLPSATACGHRQWDWALPHSSRKQQTHFTWMYIMQEKQKASWAHRVFYAPPGADRRSISNTPPQRLRSCGRCHRHAACRPASLMSRVSCSSSNASAQETTRGPPDARPPIADSPPPPPPPPPPP